MRSQLILIKIGCVLLAGANFYASTPVFAQQRIGPSFDCKSPAVSRQRLAQIICSDDELSAADLSYVIAYSALRQTLADEPRKALGVEASKFTDQVTAMCGKMIDAPTSGDIGCIKMMYDRQRGNLLGRLQGDALDEAQLTPLEAIGIQTKLRDLGYLPKDASVDGVFGPVTRKAIADWQRAAGRNATGFGSAAMVGLLGIPEHQRLPDNTTVVFTHPTVPSAGGPAPAVSPPTLHRIAKLIIQESDLNDRCRDGAPENESAQKSCDARDILIQHLNSSGWCYGTPDQVGAERQWQPCHASSPDPYAIPYAGRMMATYVKDLTNLLQIDQNIYFATGCKVFLDLSEATPLLGLSWKQFLAGASLQYIGLDESIKGDLEDAARLGLARASQQDGCRYWAENQDRVYELRQAARDALMALVH